MSDLKRSQRKLKTTQLLLGLLFIGVLTWCLAGPVGVRLKTWMEGQVAPTTIYAPFDFTALDGDRSIEVKRGELIVSRGERLTPTHVARLTALGHQQAPGRRGPYGLGALLLASLFAAVAWMYVRNYEARVMKTGSHLFLIVAASGLVLLIARGLIHSPFHPAWIPVASVSMLLALLLSPRLAIVLGLLATFLIGLMAQADLMLLVGFGVGCFVAAYGSQGIRRRIDFFRAGLFTGLAQAITILGSHLVLQWPLSAAFTPSIAGFFSGILSSLITFCLLPLAESIFGLITDVTLLELSDLNHPLLRELSVKAPGTYHHSLIVANLAEAACEAIGANSLLARVGCYFHDIGKLPHPEYFVENQPPKISRHDRLLPSLSSLVILNHVKEGIDLAQRYRLNQAIVDFIPGHHGTGLIYYFYRRALEEVEDEALLKEERFRYPGPKPQSKETAVALLADSVEAATRALREKNPGRVQEVVRRIINNKFIDGQLEECDLTLRDLNRIAEAFLRVLAGIYHSRIEYPKAPGEEPEAPREEKTA